MMRKLYLFALFFVLYEFSAYAANDLIMPGMIQVINEFQASYNYVALSLSFFILGNCTLILIVGYLAERYGKRKIVIIGNCLFILFTVLIACSQNIHQFLLFRFLQGSGLAIIAIGYALIHETFNDKDAIKLIALMANISLLAPLIGPAIGSVIVSQWSWHYVFLITAVISTISLVGLYVYMPHNHKLLLKPKFSDICKHYIQILKYKPFIKGTMCTLLAMMPLMIWISQAPNLILHTLQQNYWHYVIYQMISISGLIGSSLLLQLVVGRYPIALLIKIGCHLIIIGLLISWLGSISIWIICAGQLIYTLGLGITNSCITRLIMSQSNFPQSMLAAMMVFLQTLFLVIGITLTNSICSYFNFSLLSFTSCAFSFGLAAYMLIINHVKKFRDWDWVSS